MANTTKDEEPKAVKQQRVIVDAKQVTEDDVKALYNEGVNLYKIAYRVFGFDSDDAVARVKQILGILDQPKSRILED